MLKQGKNNSVLGKHNLTISEVGIVDRSEQSEAKTQFSAIKNILEEKEHIYIYVSADSAHIIPNRIFVNEAQKNEFLTILRQRVDLTN
ncbi:YcxB family protein [Desulfosporosinus burensis]